MNPLIIIIISVSSSLLLATGIFAFYWRFSLRFKIRRIAGIAIEIFRRHSNDNRL